MDPKTDTNPFRRRFEAKVNRSTPNACWEWTGAKRGGYGYMWVFRQTSSELAHRLAYYYEHGAFDEGLVVCHRCDNPPCCNPSHLFLGTRADNNRDRSNKGRGRESRPENRGELSPTSKLTAEQVIDIVSRVESGESQTAVAAEYGIKQPQVSRLVRRQSWVHLWVE